MLESVSDSTLSHAPILAHPAAPTETLPSSFWSARSAENPPGRKQFGGGGSVGAWLPALRLRADASYPPELRLFKEGGGELPRRSIVT